MLDPCFNCLIASTDWYCCFNGSLIYTEEKQEKDLFEFQACLDCVTLVVVFLWHNEMI